jgi:DNA-binding transcriptional regulator YdaS (Cro superfamily)
LASLDLDRVVDACEEFSAARLIAIHDRIVEQAATIPVEIRRDGCPIIPRRLTSVITHEALNHLFQQWKLSQMKSRARSLCKGLFTQIYGLPCEHTIRRMLAEDPKWTIRSSHIDPFWYY